jgi:hypothetical protein
MVSRHVFSEVMRIVTFHHAGYLDSFEADEEVVYRKLRRAWCICRAADDLIYGVRGEDGYCVPPAFVPVSVAVDAVREIREFLPALIVGLLRYYDVELKVRMAFHDSCCDFDDARNQVQVRAWWVIFDARFLTMEPLVRAARLIRGHRLASRVCLRRHGITPPDAVVDELRAIIPDHLVDLTDPLQIFDRVLIVHAAAFDWCLEHPPPLCRGRSFGSKIHEYPGRACSDHSFFEYQHPPFPC